MFLLRFIPEPWGTVILVSVVLIAYAYGNITGRGSERLKNEVANLTAKTEVLTATLNNAIAIQTRAAENAAAIRISNEQLRARGTDLEKRLLDEEKRNPARACILSDAERMQLKAIRIGGRTNTRAR